MPTFEERPNQLEVLVSEMLAKQDETTARLEQLTAEQKQTDARLRQVNATMLNRFTEHDARFDRLEAQMVETKTEVGDLRVEMRQGFAIVNQRLTDLLTLLSERIK